MKPRIGLFSGGIEQYWTEAGMHELPGRLDADARRLAANLGPDVEVVYPGLAGNPSEARRVGQVLRREGVDLVLMYHATYVDDAMTLAVLEEAGDLFPVLFQSQGVRGFVDTVDLTDAGRTWGNNSTVQISGTLKRVRPELRFGFVFGDLDSPRALEDTRAYARAARAVRSLKGRRVGFLPDGGMGGAE